MRRFNEHKVAYILNQILEDKSTQTTVRTYIKATTHSPTHTHKPTLWPIYR